MNTYEIELEVEGEQIPVTLEEVGPLTSMKIVGTIPTELSLNPEMDPEDMPVGVLGEMEQYVVTLVGEVSDFPIELLDELPKEKFVTLVKSCALAMTGNDPTEYSNVTTFFEEDTPLDAFEDNNDPFANLDLNSDGTLDPDDWR